MDMRAFSRSDRAQRLMIFAAVVILLMFPSLLRWYYFQIPAIVGGPTYMHHRTAHDIISGGFNFYDELSYGGRPYTYPPGYVYMLALFEFAFGDGWGGALMMALFGGFASILFCLLLREFRLPKAGLIFLMATPLFIYLFGHLSTRTPPIVLGLLSIYWFLKKRHFLASALPLGISFLFSPESGIIFTAVLMIYAFDKRLYMPALKTLAVAWIIAAVYLVPFFMANGMFGYNSLHQDYLERGYGLEQASFGKFFWETGVGADSLPVVVFILAVIGFVYSKDRFLRAWLLFSIILSFVAWRAFIYAVFPLGAIAAAGFMKMKADRKRPYIRLLAWVFLAYMIVAACVFAFDFSGTYPKNEHVKAFTWIRENTPNDSVILSDWSHGHWIAGLANRKNFMDGYAEYAPVVDARMQALNQFYDDCTVPKGYGITHIYMEDWIIRRERTECIYDEFDTVYNSSYVFVFEV